MTTNTYHADINELEAAATEAERKWFAAEIIALATGQRSSIAQAAYNGAKDIFYAKTMRTSEAQRQIFAELTKDMESKKIIHVAAQCELETLHEIHQLRSAALAAAQACAAAKV